LPYASRSQLRSPSLRQAFAPWSEVASATRRSLRSPLARPSPARRARRAGARARSIFFARLNTRATDSAPFVRVAPLVSLAALALALRVLHRAPSSPRFVRCAPARSPRSRVNSRGFAAPALRLAVAALTRGSTNCAHCAHSARCALANARAPTCAASRRRARALALRLAIAALRAA